MYEEDIVANYLYSPDRPFPNKVQLTRFYPVGCTSDTIQIYVKRQYCTANITMYDDDNTIGKCTCSICKKRMNPFDKFCPNCGAKSKGRHVVKDKRDEDN